MKPHNSPANIPAACTMPDSDTGIGEYIRSFKKSPILGRQVVFHHESDRKEAVFQETVRPPRPELGNIMHAAGASGLYLHQAMAIDAIRQGRNIVVATSTASGKTLTYNLPVIEKILEEPSSRALYLFPLKALANDQMATFSRMARLAASDRDITCGIYDGDTSAWNRKKIRRAPPNVLFTNPEMLHLALLPYHSSWGEFIKNLKFVVVDEVHTYRGMFGSHMAWVFRRLKRICQRYGSDPLFIFCSATVGNPGELASGLTGMDVMPITQSGAPCGRRHFLMVDPEDGGAAQMAVQLLLAAIHRGLRTIVYTQSRKLTELINIWARQRAPGLAHMISAYRAGFLPEERREIEAKMSDGSLLAVISTSALELGIDIGALDLCILVGYPGTVMSTWQRGGRVGRSMRESAVVMIAQKDALDMYFLHHPHELVSRKAEAAVINPLNSVIAEKHLLCAAAELPIRSSEDMACPDRIKEVMHKLEQQGRLMRSADGKMLFASRRYPHGDVSLRGTGHSFHIVLRDTGEIIGTVDGFRAMRETHPGAIYLHRGRTYLVESLDIQARTAVVKPVKVNYFTRVMAEKDIEILKTVKTVSIGASLFSFGMLKVTEHVTGFEQRMVRGQRLISKQELDLPPQIFETEGMWFTVPDRIREAVENERMHFMGGIHALEHAIIGILPLFVLTDRNDLGGLSLTWHPQCGSAAVFIYDGVPGGIGLCKEAFRKAGAIMERVIKTISACPCENGCPSCVHSPKCGSGNRPVAKDAALFTAKALLKKQYAPGVIFGNSHPEPRNRRAKYPEQEIQSTLPEHIAESTAGDTTGKGHLLENYMVFDVETQLSASEVGGWHMAHMMKVSCAVLYSSIDNQYHTFFENDLHDFFELLGTAELVAGFNINRFDYRVLSAYTDMDLWKLPTLDLLEKIHTRLGYRLSLDCLASATLGTGKSADGLLALKWWKQGQLRKIADYCRKDVEITRDLIMFASENAYLLFRNKSGSVVRIPVTIP